MSQPRTSLQGARVLLGVSGGIAAYKAAHVLRGLLAAGADVQVVPTEASLAFVGRATWEALSHRPVLTSVFDDVDHVAHVELGQQADLVAVVPATADLMARARAGRADDLLTASLLVTQAPVVLAPAMHTEMWQHPATQENVRVLRERGVTVLEPAIGQLTGSDTGAGRLPEPDAVLAALDAAITSPREETGAIRRDLAGAHVLITAGGTREEIDPVRYIANRSSGRQGWALAHAALARGARVTLLAANCELETPPGAERIDVTSAQELAEQVAVHRRSVDVVVMAAAVADFTPLERANAKIKKTDEQDAPQIPLRRTEDILRSTVEERGDATRPAIVGFAAETGSEQTSALELAREKARRKGADLLVFNDVTTGVFGSDSNRVRILDANGSEITAADGSKQQVAHALLDALSAVVRQRGDVPWSA